MERSVIEDGGVKVAVIACVESSISFHCIEATLALKCVDISATGF
jgi:hypothetical protein